MKIIAGIFAGLLSILSAVAAEREWKDLFNGTGLEGWEASTAVNWRVENGSILADSGREGLLVTKDRFTDYEIEIEFRAAEDTRSGIFLSTRPVVTDPSSECYELSIAPDSSAYPTGSLEGRERVTTQRESKEWRTYRAVVEGDTVTVWLDGTKTVTYRDRKPLKGGRIGLQFDQGRIEFRKIRIKNLGLP